jgi:hypothetical protein
MQAKNIVRKAAHSAHGVGKHRNLPIAILAFFEAIF